VSGRVITIDGPAGSGKSTVARKLSERLGYAYVDTGAMYRGITWLALRRKMDLDDEGGLTMLARETEIAFEHDRHYRQPYRVLVDGKDVTTEIRSKRVTAHVSQVSAVAGVRAELVKKQRELAAGRDVVMEGRDIGTVVFPEAEEKFFIIASVEERARRRCEDFRRDGYDFDEEAVRRDLVKRDLYDSSRPNSPMSVAGEAVIIDTTEMSVDEVVSEIIRRVGGGEAP
jgi:cytidylate kinase